MDLQAVKRAESAEDEEDGDVIEAARKEKGWEAELWPNSFES